jgi:hypothetical protein
MKAKFPLLTFNTDIKEEDPFWTAGKAESQSAQALRVSNFLESISHGPEIFLSITSHGALIKVFLDVVGHPNPKFNLTTGQIIPVLVRTERVMGLKNEVGIVPPLIVNTCPLCGPTA